jgi:hypothetical protein
MLLTVILTISILSVPVSAQIFVERSLQDSALFGEEVVVSFDIDPTKTISNFDFVELIPLDWEIDEWWIDGYNNESIDYTIWEYNYSGKIYSANHWKFNEDFSDQVIINYKMTPSEKGKFILTAIWTFPEGFSSDSKVFVVTSAAPIAFPTEMPSSMLLIVPLFIIIIWLLWKFYYRLPKRVEKRVKLPGPPEAKIEIEKLPKKVEQPLEKNLRLLESRIKALKRKNIKVTKLEDNVLEIKNLIDQWMPGTAKEIMEEAEAEVKGLEKQVKK